MSQNLHVLHAVRRSGHNAIIHWLMPVLGCENKLEVYQLRKLENVDIKSNTIINIEEFLCNDVLAKLDDLNINATTILSVRDPFNCFASRMEHRSVTPRRSFYNHIHSKVKELWKEHAKAFLQKDIYDHKIIYNFWFKDIDYRKQLSDEMNGTFTDKAFNKISRVGGGSSFQIDVSSNSDLKTDERYKAYLNNNTYLQMFDEEVFDLSRQIFGSMDALDEVYLKWKDIKIKKPSEYKNPNRLLAHIKKLSDRRDSRLAEASRLSEKINDLVEQLEASIDNADTEATPLGRRQRRPRR